MKKELSVIPGSILDPSGEVEGSLTILAPRLGILEGKTIGLFDNRKTKARFVLDIVKEGLEKTYNVDNFLYVREAPYLLARIPPETLSELSKADAVVAAVGDCGSCTWWTLLTTLELEKKGVPTCTIVTEPFAQLSAVALESHCSSQPIVIIKTTSAQIAKLSDLEIREAVEPLLTEIVKAIASET